MPITTMYKHRASLALFCAWLRASYKPMLLLSCMQIYRRLRIYRSLFGWIEISDQATHTAVEVGVQAWKLLGNIHMCPSQCPICAQHVYKLGHSLYTGATAWPLLVHWRCIQAWALLGHICTFPSSFQAWALQLLQQ